MSNAITLRVLIDHEDDVFRDIKISDDSTFEELHLAIQDAFGFDGQQMASFYLSNNDWDKGEEISMMSLNEDGTAGQQMDNTILSLKITEVNQKVLYVFDFLLMWCFYIEVQEITPAIENEGLPLLMREYGKAPDQYSKDIDLSGSIDYFNDDDYEEEKQSDDIFEDFNDFEQYV